VLIELLRLLDVTCVYHSKLYSKAGNNGRKTQNESTSAL